MEKIIFYLYYYILTLKLEKQWKVLHTHTQTHNLRYISIIYILNSRMNNLNLFRGVILKTSFRLPPLVLWSSSLYQQNAQVC